MADHLSRLCRAWFRRPTRARRSPATRFAPRLELLEDRTVPAGVVNATQIGGVLTITGVNDPNDVDILNTNHQNITLDGAGGNDFTVTANDGETGTAFSTFNNVTKIKLVMGLGNDTVTITNTTLTGLVDFKGGSGDNTLRIDGAGNFSGEGVGNNTLGSVKVANGDGEDIFTIGGGTNAITGSLTISNGLGGASTNVNQLVTDVTTIGGATTVTNLDGEDLFLVDTSVSATFTGKVTISNGNGETSTRFNATTTTLTGGLSVTNGDGDDNFTTGGTTFIVGTPAVRRNLTISNGTCGFSTDQNFQATTNTINGNLRITALFGRDDLSVTGTDFKVLGSVTIKTGNGDGTIGSTSTLDISPTNLVDIDGAVSVICGEGDEVLSFGATTVNLASVRFSSGNGLSTLDFTGGTTTVTGGISHTNAVGGSVTTFDGTTNTINGTITSSHGDGVDTFDVNGTNFSAGALIIQNGVGGSETNIDATTSSTISGAISITNGDGSDYFQTGGTTCTIGNLTIRNGTGSSDTEFNAGTDTINGSILVINGNGLDDFTVNSPTFAVTGSVTISNGVGSSGTSTIRFITGVSTIGGKLTVTATDGEDAVFLRRLTVTGVTSFNTGNGADEVLADNSTFAAFKVITGAGGDLVRIENGILNDGTRTIFNGAVNINLGAGDDQLLIGFDVDDFGEFNAAATFAGGPDLDIFVDNPNNDYNNPPVTSGFEQVT